MPTCDFRCGLDTTIFIWLVVPICQVCFCLLRNYCDVDDKVLLRFLAAMLLPGLIGCVLANMIMVSCWALLVMSDHL
jgi:hypothetical protein